MNEELLKKIDNLVEKEVVEEAKKYPSQYEAEALLNWTEAMGKISMDFGGAPVAKAAFDKAEKARTAVWDKIFGDKSPWKLVMKGSKGKRQVVWDNYKADQLGL